MVQIAQSPIAELSLEQITSREVALYAGVGKDQMYAVLDDTNKRYAVIIVPEKPEERPSWVVVMAQVVGDKIVILEDITYQPLHEALMVNAGVPRAKIILAYKGEQIPAVEQS